MEMEIEKREFCGLVELRGDDDKPKRIGGLGAVFYRKGDPETEFRLWGNIYERFMPGCFDKAIAEDDIRSMFNHDMSNLLGRTKSGTLTLSVDGRGLLYEVEPAETQIYRDVVELIARGDVDGSSVQMRVTEETWRTENEDSPDEIEVREITEARLFEVGPVANPAYKGTTADARFEEVRSSHAKWVDSRQVKIQQSLREKELELIKLGA